MACATLGSVVVLTGMSPFPIIRGSSLCNAKIKPTLMPQSRKTPLATCFADVSSRWK